MSQFMVANPDADTTEAGCVVDELIREYSIEGLARELEATPVATAFERTQFVAMFECGLRADVEDSLAAQLEESGITAEDAHCAAASLSDDLDRDDLAVLLDGEITDQFYEKYFVALESCNALS